MAARIREELGLEVELVRGSGGVFDVVHEGDLLFSKHQHGTFPDEDADVLEPLKARLG